MRVKIVKRDNTPPAFTEIYDADTGEQIIDVESYTIAAHVKDDVVHADLVRYELPKRVDPATGEVPKYTDRAEVAELVTDAETEDG